MRSHIIAEYVRLGSPVVQIVDHIHFQIMDRMSTRMQRAEKWATVLCSESQKILNKNMSESFSLYEIIASDDVYEVFN